MTRPSTPDKKKIKYLWLQHEDAAVNATPETNEDTIAAPDDIRIVGFDLIVRGSIKEATVIVADGTLDFSATLARGAASALASFLGYVSGRLHADGASILTNINPGSMHMNIMYPEGYGIDLDEGDPLNLYVTNRQTIHVGADAIVLGIAQVFYVER